MRVYKQETSITKEDFPDCVYSEFLPIKDGGVIITKTDKNGIPIEGIMLEKMTTEPVILKERNDTMGRKSDTIK